MKGTRNTEDQEKCLDRKEVIGMQMERVEWHYQVPRIIEEATTTNGKSYLLPGLQPCRLATAYSQRDLAQKICGSQTTIRPLERGYRGAYISTITRLCAALGVAPAALLCESSDIEERPRR